VKSYRNRLCRLFYQTDKARKDIKLCSQKEWWKIILSIHNKNGRKIDVYITQHCLKWSWRGKEFLLLQGILLTEKKLKQLSGTQRNPSRNLTGIFRMSGRWRSGLHWTCMTILVRDSQRSIWYCLAEKQDGVQSEPSEEVWRDESDYKRFNWSIRKYLPSSGLKYSMISDWSML